MNRSSTATAAHYLTRALLLAGFAFFIVYLVRSGSLNLYIASKMQFIVKCSALGLYAIAAQQLYVAIRTFFEKSDNAPSCDCNHEMPATWGRSILLYGWFTLPLIIGFTVPDGLLGSSMAAAKGVQFAQQLVKPTTTTTSNQPTVTIEPLESDQASDTELPYEDASPIIEDWESKDTADSTESITPPASARADSKKGQLSEEMLDALFPYDQFTESYAKFGRKLVQQELIEVNDKQFIETLTTLDLYRTAFIGKTVQLSGFVYREKTMGKQQFGISRFAITCCSADASPYGVMVKFGRGETLATDEWVTVTGKLSTTQYNDIEIIQIDVTKVVKITPPEDPYVTPDLDFGLE